MPDQAYPSYIDNIDEDDLANARYVHVAACMRGMQHRETSFGERETREGEKTKEKVAGAGA